ncbi:hypothetical protein ABT160_43665 [Streptomyces sp. NPDC001941]|uniref:hypothetical protein n=1 Tax=Streptomyces sp. NPDC001941 TaxID=3154659 RepID=UPI00333205E6
MSFFDLNTGSPIRRPRRLPVTDAKKFAYAVSRSRREDCKASTDTSASHARSGVRFASVITRFARAPDEIRDLSALYAAFLAASASL